MNSWNLHSSELCAGGEVGVDACDGEGGAPLVCLDEVGGGNRIGGNLKKMPSFRTPTSSMPLVLLDMVLAARMQSLPSTPTLPTRRSSPSLRPLSARTSADNYVYLKVTT